MRSLLTKCLRKCWLRFYRFGIADALALHRRNEVRSDGLALKSTCNRLEISWVARSVHPWDENLPSIEKEILFAQQTLEDTEAAVIRVFERLPEVDILDIRVLAPQTGELLAAGTVPREVVHNRASKAHSVRMRLGDLGIKCRIAPYYWGDSGQLDNFPPAIQRTS